MTRPVHRRDLDDGSAILTVGYREDDAIASLGQKLARETETPTPSDGDGSAGGGPIRRATSRFAALRLPQLRRIALQGHEISDAVRTRRDELYRNEFPVLKPRFASACEACGSEFDVDHDDCPACGNEELRRPDPAEKREADRLLTSVNREGQSLRELAKECEPDQWLCGVSTIVIRYEYAVATDSELVADGTLLQQTVDELVRADPAQLRPVVDEHGRLGGHQWACPLHREQRADAAGACETCGADLRAVHYEEVRRDGDSQVYFADEVLDWAYPYPKLGGADGIAPAAVVWLRQAILDMMDRYGAAFYDPGADRLPNQFMILHTTNPDHWEAQLEKVRDEDDPYDSPIFSNEYSPQDASTPEVQVIDAMPDELLGQSQAVKSDYKEDIRQAFGISNVHDSDLSDAGGLNNEGLQLEVTDRSIASQQHDYIEGWLDTLAKRLGIDDWRIEFLPNTGPDASELQEEVRTAALAARAGLDARLEDGQAEIADGAVELDAGDAGPGSLPDPLGEPGGEGDDTDDDAPASAPAAVPTQAATVGRKASAPTEALELLERAHRHIVWCPPQATGQKAEPFFDGDEDVPAFVVELVREAIGDGALHTSFEALSTGARGRLADVLTENLTQPQGWSLRSIADDLQEAFGLPADEAETIARSEVKAINDRARELGYERQGAADEARFKWLGPADDRKHEACWWLLEQTNPDYGGEPVSLDELRSLVAEANDRFVDGHDARRYSPHINCRDTYVQHFG
jgi:hypothetical protein